MIASYDQGGIALERLVGKRVSDVYVNTEHLIFVADGEYHGFVVDADCCSQSYFYDFYGVRKLLDNGPVTSVDSIDVSEPSDEDSRRGEYVQAYGYELVTEHPRFGEQTSVFSFRNDSNGYYGGSLRPLTVTTLWTESLLRLSDDITDIDRATIGLRSWYAA